MRLSFGCGSIREDGWVGLDLDQGDVMGDGRRLPFRDEAFDAVHSNHSLCALEHHDVPLVLAELRRVLRPGGCLRVIAPSILGAARALGRDDRAWFPNTAEASTDAAFCAYVTWYSTNRSILTPAFLFELLIDAGFSQLAAPGWLDTLADDVAIFDLDDRWGESFVAEALR